MKIDPLAISNADPAETATACFAMLDRMQDYPPHVQVLAAAAVFTALTAHYKQLPQDVFTLIANMMNTKEGKRAEFAAVLDYIKYEL